MKTDSRLYMLTGHVGEGKTTLLDTWAADQQNIYGLLTPRTTEGRSFRIIESGEEWPMQGEEQSNDDILVGQHRFSRAAFLRANSYLQSLKSYKKGLFIIDEYGKLECNQKGLYDGISQLLTELHINPDIRILIVVRSSLSKEVADSLGIPAQNILTLSNFKNKIRGILNQ